MSDSNASQPADRQARLEQILADYLRSVEQGQPLDRSALIAAHPDLADDLQAFFRNHDSMDRLADPLKAAAEAPTITGILDAETAPAGTTVRYFGDYELLAEIARGGMGVVYKARQVNLNRIVALKMILAGQLAHDSDVKRFYAEAEAAAKLDHPGIVPIFEIGQHEGQHYFSMAFVEGESLAKKVANGPLPPREAAALVKTVAEAVEYAHQKGIIHRDLKPANVLLDQAGQPRVTDFGLAKQIQGDSGLTGTGQILGTPSYMPPEQASGKTDEMGPGADVYALGAVLYCLLTGRAPFQAASPVDTLRQVLEQEPVSARLLNAQVPIDLETIASKCLEKEPLRRYGSAQQLAKELERFLDGRPILARPVGRMERFQRWCLREPVVATLVTAVALLLVTSSVGGLWLAHGERESKSAAQGLATRNKNLSDEKGELAEHNARLAREESAAKVKALGLAAANEKLAVDERAGRLATERQLRIATAEQFAVLSHSKRTESPELSLLLALESGRATRHEDEGFLPSSHQAVLDALTHIGGRPLIGHRDHVSCMAISSDGRWIVTGSVDKTARIWDLTAEDPATKPRVLSGHEGPISSVAISSNGRWIVAMGGDLDHTARVWDLTANDPGANPLVLGGPLQPITSVAISPDSRWLVTGHLDNTARVWDLTAKNPAGTPRVLGNKRPNLFGMRGITSVAVTPDSHWVVTASAEVVVRVWDLTSENPSANPRILNRHQLGIRSVAISPDGRWLVTGSDDRTARIWDLTDENPAPNARVLTGRHAVSNVAISPDMHWIVTAYDDGAVHIWDFTAENPAADPRVLTGHQGRIHGVAISPDSRWLVTGSDDKIARVWELTAANAAANPRVLSGHQGSISSTAITTDSRWIVTGSYDHTARVWDLAAEGPSANPRVLSGHPEFVTSVAISPDSRWIVTQSSYDYTARVWDLTAENPSAKSLVLGGQHGSVTSEAISSDSRWIVTGNLDGTIRVWNLTAENPAAAPRVLSNKGHNVFGLDGITSVAMSPDSHWIVKASPGGTVLVDFTVENPAANSRVLSGNKQGVTRLAISPDSRWLVTQRTIDQTARVWDLAAEDPSANPRVLSGHRSVITSVAISPDSRWIVTGNMDSTARVWDLTAEDPVANPRILSGHQRVINRVAISPDSRWVVTGSDDKTARIWDLTAENPAENPRVLRGHQSFIRSLAITPDSRWVVTGSDDKTARVWDLTALDVAAKACVLTGHQGEIRSVVISADNRWIITGSLDGTVRIWDLTARNPAANPRILTGNQNLRFEVAMSADNRWIVTRTGNKTVRVWRWQWDDLVALAAGVGRNFDREEWEQYFPGEPYRKTFPDLPVPRDP